MDVSRRRVTLAALLAAGFGLGAFDALRKTVFVDAAWNYNYQYWNFVYDPVALVALVALFAGLVALWPRLVELDRRYVPAVLFVVVLALFGLSLFALPLKMVKALDVDKRGLYAAALFFLDNGPLSFFEAYHALPRTVPQHDELYVGEFAGPRPIHRPVAEALAARLRAVAWLPFNDALAAEVARIGMQRHGPVSVLLVVPFLYVFGRSTAVAVAADLVLVALVPVFAYLGYREYFSEAESRLGALLVGTAPALFIFTRQGAPVPYDAFTALLVAASTALLLQGINRGSWRRTALSAVVFSLAALTKLTALLAVPPFLLVLAWHHAPDLRAGASAIGQYVGVSAIVPTAFLLAGYNTVVQYLFTVYKVVFYKSGGRGSVPASDPRAALNDALIGVVGTMYNLRWMNVALLVFAVAFVVDAASDANRRGVRAALAPDHRLLAAVFLLPLLPFLMLPLTLSGTLSRHAVVVVVFLGFVALAGLRAVGRVSWREGGAAGAGDGSDGAGDGSDGAGDGSGKEEWLTRVGRVSLAVAAIGYLINI